jgi:hypothetical protein
MSAESVANALGGRKAGKIPQANIGKKRKAWRGPGSKSRGNENE